MFEMTVKKPKPDAPKKLTRFRKRVRPNMMDAFTIVAARAESQVKGVDLSRGGGFRITKTSTGSGRRRGPATPKWIKNTSPYPRVGDGTLRSSWRYERASISGFGRIRSRIHSNVVYARIIELGGRAGRGRRVYLKGWPYIAPMIARNRRRFIKIAGRKVFSGFRAV